MKIGIICLVYVELVPKACFVELGNFLPADQHNLDFIKNKGFRYLQIGIK